MVNETNNVWTLGLLAGAYNKQTEKKAVTHAYADGADSTMCGRVIADKLADVDAYQAEELAALPTCPVCAKKDPRR